MILQMLLHFTMTFFVQVVVMLLKSFSCFCNLLKAFTCAWLLFAHFHLAEFQRKETMTQSKQTDQWDIWAIWQATLPLF